MNKERRTKLQKEINQLSTAQKVINTVEKKTLLDFLEHVRGNIESICDDEQAAFDNMPEGLQYSMRGEISEECIDLMTEVTDNLGEIKETLEDEAADKDELTNAIEEVKDLLEEVICA